MRIAQKEGEIESTKAIAMEVLTAAQMRAVERAAIDGGSVTGLALMERAGQGVVDAIFETWPVLVDSAQNVVVLCGPGNNGGDGFVVARLLSERGWAVRTYLLGDAEALPSDARINHDKWIEIGTCEAMSERSLGSVKFQPDMVIDALFGTGLSRPVDDIAAFLLTNFDVLRDELAVKCVAIDIPSGVCADSGKSLGCFTSVDLTVSFHSAKVGHHLDQASAHSHRLVVKDIGLPHTARADAGASQVWTVGAPPRRMLRKSVSAQKYGYGHALIMAGGPTHTGAARLAARGALRVGAGLVTLGVVPSALAEVASQSTAVMLTRVPNADALSELLWDTRLNALCLGPGLGLDHHSKALVSTVLPLKRPVVLDADALTMFRDDPGTLFSMLHDTCILTPHGGEFARLFPDIDRKLRAVPSKGPAYSKVDATRAAAKRAGCTVLFKGADTVIASPDGRCSINSAQYERAAPWLATAGAGDVLAGFITGLLARGLDPHAAAETGTWLHVECAIGFGPGLIAEDIPEVMPQVLRGLGV